jgi:hypothetical protein
MAITLNGDTGITTPAETIQGNLTTTGNTILGDASTDTLNVGNGGLVKDASGNLGLGVTPSAWNTNVKSVQLASGSVYSYTTIDLELTQNCYYSTGNQWIYSTTAPAERYQLYNGTHVWYTAPSGTAGNAITFTQAMTLSNTGLDINATFGGSSFPFRVGFTTAGTYYPQMVLNDSGNLGIGTASPVSRLDVEQANAKSSTASWQFNVGDLTSQATGVGGGITFSGYKTATSAKEYFAGIDAYKENSTAGNAAGALRFHTQVSGGSGLVERMRIDSSGNLLVGTTSAIPGTNTAKSNVYTSSSNAFYAATGDTSFTSDVVRFGCLRTSSSAYNLLACFSGNGSGDNMSVVRMYVRGDGGIGNYSANNVNLSDRREKTNFAPAKSYLDVICAIPVQTYNYIDQNMEEDGGLTLGVVAQDVQSVAPELVTESDWSTEKDGSKMRLSIYQTDLQYALMKCIQEQQAMIDELKAKVAALEAA